MWGNLSKDQARAIVDAIDDPAKKKGAAVLSTQKQFEDQPVPTGNKSGDRYYVQAS